VNFVGLYCIIILQGCW